MKVGSKLAAVFLFCLLVSTLASFFYANYRAQQQFDRALQHLESQFGFYADLLADPIWNFENETVNKILATLSEDPDVVCVQILDSNNQMLFKKGDNEKARDAPYRFSVPIIFSSPYVTKTAGALVVYVSNGSMLEDRQTALKEWLLLTFAILLVLSVGAWVFLRLVVAKPLNSMLQAIRESRGERYPLIRLRPNDEFGEVIRAFNRSQQRLQKQHVSLKDSEKRLDRLYNTTPAILFSLSMDGRIIDANEYFLSYFCVERANIMGRQMDMLIAPVHRADVQSKLLGPLIASGSISEFFTEVVIANGKTHSVLVEARVHDVAGKKQILALMTDISGLVHTQKELDHQASHDRLTGLINRFGFQGVLEQSIQNLKPGRSLALILFDLDHFKSVNDIFGHHAGDTLIHAVASRIKDAMPAEGYLARLGGDEFAVLLTLEDHTKTLAETICQRILNQISQPVVLLDSHLHITASMGVAFYPSDAMSSVELLQNADIAMYRAKDKGRSGFHCFEREMQDSISRRAWYESVVRGALDQNRVQVYFQPIVDLRDGSVQGVEALVRIQDEDGQFISPADFIPIAEETGLIVALGDEVLKQAATHARQWQQRLGDHFYVSVNFSMRQFQASGFLQSVEKVLADSELPPSSLLIELTEGLLIQNNRHNQEVLDKLHDMGCRLAIDDFGTGYSALSYLHQFPIDVLKIDRSFVKDCVDNKTHQSLILAILSMSKGLDVKVVAEGIEETNQLNFLVQRGCTFGQGYLFGRPMAAQELDNWLNKQATASYI